MRTQSGRQENQWPQGRNDSSESHSSSVAAVGLEAGLRLSLQCSFQTEPQPVYYAHPQNLTGKEIPQPSCSNLSPIGLFLSKLLTTLIKWDSRHGKVTSPFSYLNDWNSRLTSPSPLHSTNRILLLQYSSHHVVLLTKTFLPLSFLVGYSRLSTESEPSLPHASQILMALNHSPGPQVFPQIMLMPYGILSACLQRMPTLTLEPPLMSYDDHFICIQISLKFVVRPTAFILFYVTPMNDRNKNVFYPCSCFIVTKHFHGYQPINLKNKNDLVYLAFPWYSAWCFTQGIELLKATFGRYSDQSREWLTSQCARQRFWGWTRQAKLRFISPGRYP